MESKPGKVGTIAKAMGAKMTAKVVGKNSRFCFSVKNNLN